MIDFGKIETQRDLNNAILNEYIINSRATDCIAPNNEVRIYTSIYNIENRRDRTLSTITITLVEQQWPMEISKITAMHTDADFNQTLVSGMEEVISLIDKVALKPGWGMS